MSKEKKGNKSCDKEEPSAEYVVEAVVGKRPRNGKVEYLLEWASTWEAVENLRCRKKIEEFEAKFKTSDTNKKNKEKKSSDERETPEFGVQSILGRWTTNGKIEYLVKWEPTWEPMENIDGTYKIDKFEAKLKKEENHTVRMEPDKCAKNASNAATNRVPVVVMQEKTPLLESNKQKTNSPGSSKPKRKKLEKKKMEPKSDSLNSFDRGWEVEKIIGATDSNQELKFLVKWVDYPILELVPAKIAHVRCPLAVIDFYEERIVNW